MKKEKLDYKIASKLLILMFLFFTSIVLLVIDCGIRTHNIAFYSGKYGGYSMRFYATILLTPVFFIVMEVHRKQLTLLSFLRLVLQGIFVAISIGIVCYLWLPSDSFGTVFHVVSLTISFLCYFIVKKK